MEIKNIINTKHKIKRKTLNLWYLIYIIAMFLMLSFFFICIFSLNLRHVEQNNLKLLVVLNVMMGIVIMAYCISKNIKEYFTLFAFTFVYLVFNLGSYLADFNGNPFGYISFAGTVTYTYYDEAIGLIIIFVGITSYFAAYRLSKKIKIRKYRMNSDAIDRKYNIQKIRSWSKVAMYIGAVATFTKVGLMILQVQTFGYTSIYVNTSYNIIILNMFDSFFELGLFSFLITMPPLHKIKYPLILYFVYSCFTLLYGRRNAFVTGALIIIWYLLKMDVTERWKKQIMTKAKVFIVGIASVLGITFLYYFSLIRHSFGEGTLNRDISSVSFGNAIKLSIEQLGFSGKLLPLTISMEAELVDLGRLKAIFYPITNYLNGNVIARMLGFGQLATQAASGGNIQRYTLGGWLTYFFWPSAYLGGGGVGTNYLAESYIFMGFFGVMLVNFMYGYLFYKIDNFESNTWRSRLFGMYFFSIVVMLPRSSALNIIPQSIVLIVYILVLMFLSKRKK